MDKLKAIFSRLFTVATKKRHRDQLPTIRRLLDDARQGDLFEPQEFNGVKWR